MKNLLGVVFVGAIIIYFNRGWLGEIVDTFSGDGGFNTVALTASDLDCDRLAEEWTGKSVSNNFGAEFKLMKIFEPREESRNEDKLSCLADAMFDRGEDDKVRMTYERDRDGDWWNTIEVVID